MSIRLLQAIFLSGVYTAVDGATLTLDASIEADLVGQGKAEWIYKPLTRTQITEHKEAHAAIGIKGRAGALSSMLNLLVEPPVSGITTIKTANCTLNFSGQAGYGRETVWKITATSVGASQYFEIVLPTHAGFSATDLLWEMAVDNVDALTAVYPYLANVGYTRYVSGTIGDPRVPTVTRAPSINTMSAYHLSAAGLTKSGFSSALGDEVFREAKIRFVMASDSTVTVHLRSVGVSTRGQSRIAIVADDGYNSFFDIGVPILREYGLLSSAAIIRTAVGLSGYADIGKLKRYVSAGNECVPHGPSVGAGSGNLFSAWTTNADRLSDVASVSKYLLDNGLTSLAGARCYIWPQGQFCAATDDLSFVNDMIGAGYMLGRGITSYLFYEHRANAISLANPGRLLLNIVGHSWVSAGTEAANIATIIGKIQAAAANGLDCVLMIHKVVGVDAAAASIEISSNRLRELCVAIRALVDAGSQDCVLFSDLAS